MTQEQKPEKEIEVTPEMTFEERARGVLSISEYNMLMAYMAKGGHPLAPSTAGQFYLLFLNGSPIGDIHRLNKQFPYESILHARVRYFWDAERDKYLVELQNSIKEKLIKTQLETVSFLSDMITAANIKHGDKLKRFIQTRDDKDLGDALAVDSINALLKVSEGIQKLTGQDKSHTIKKEENINLNVSNAILPTDSSGLSAEGAAKILSVMAEEKRKQAREKK